MADPRSDQALNWLNSLLRSRIAGCAGPFSAAAAPRSASGRSRGFTLIEMMVVVAIVVIAGAIAIPWFQQLQRVNRLSQVTRKLVGNMRVARAYAVSGTDLCSIEPTAGAPCNCGAGACPARIAGVQFDSTTRYRLFLDGDNALGGEVFISTIDLTTEKGTSARLDAALTGIQFRFQSNGLARTDPPAPMQIDIADAVLKQRRRIVVSGVGLVTVSDAVWGGI